MSSEKLSSISAPSGLLKMVVKPVARFYLRNNHKFQTFMQAAKECFLEVAQEELNKKGEKVNVSRLAVYTGICREEVTRIHRDSGPPGRDSANLPDKVLAQWQTDRRFRTARGKPRILSYGGEESEFYQLVRSVTRSVHPSGIAFQLRQQGVVNEAPSGLQMVSDLRSFEGDPEAQLEVVCNDLDDLLLAGEQNVFTEEESPNLHIRTSYDNVILDAREQIRAWLVEQGKTYHKRVRNYLARFDKDVNPELEGKAGKLEVIFSTFSVTKEPKVAE